MLRWILSFLSILALITPHGVYAALRTQNALPSEDALYNPKADADDILLPMPCGLSLALRTIAVPGGVNRDRRFLMGVSNTQEKREIYESSFESHIAASFAVGDLPAKWHEKLGVAKPEGFSYYFLGKYELSAGQWESVMQAIGDDGSYTESHCPRQSAEYSLPVRNISWFEVQDFLRRYNAWLIKEASADLPHYAGTNNIGFLRLPTEEEWEFAARGGIAVREEDRENNDSFVPREEKAEDYGVFLCEGASILENPLSIGSRKPNPLMLYDTMGNVREMIDGFFHLTIMEIGANNSQKSRLHGASGGLLCKGGSYHSDEEGVLPGWRDEIPLYTEHGEYKANDLGVRLLLAGINIPNASRLRLMSGTRPVKESANSLQNTPSSSRTKEEGKKENADVALSINMQGDVLQELDRITNATSSSTVRANLSQLRSLLSQREQAQARQQVDFLENTLRSSLYQAETIRAFAFRYIEVAKLLHNTPGNKPLSKEEKNQVTQVLNSYYTVLLTAANQYKSHIRRILNAEQDRIQDILAQLKKEYQGSDTLSRHMQENLATLQQHLARAQNSGIERLINAKLCADIIPKQHLQQMPHFIKK
ncbi:MAG: SUMF1/EgtB/PvdO family nonheme iron enzyme [Desulfovibrio sp.]|nr:SUMF1/EgtB/PvdO family nonheme iron enzyme [Desulfovibrio sp.]